MNRRKRLRKNNRKTARGIQLESARSEEEGKKGKSNRRNNNESKDRIKKKRMDRNGRINGERDKVEKGKVKDWDSLHQRKTKRDIKKNHRAERK